MASRIPERCIGARFHTHHLKDRGAFNICCDLDFVVIDRFKFFKRRPDKGTLNRCVKRFSDKQVPIVGFLAITQRDRKHLQDLEFPELLNRVREVLLKYPQVKVWNLANEVFSAGDLVDLGWGDDWLLRLFEAGRQAAPDAELMINEYAIQNKAYWDGVYHHTQRLTANGLVDWVGIQIHSTTDNRKFSPLQLATVPGKLVRQLIRPIPTQRIDFEIERFKQLGLKVHLTECSVNGDNDHIKHALYMRYARAAARADAFSFWSLFDGPPDGKGYQPGGDPGLYRYHSKKHQLKDWAGEVLQELRGGNG